MSTEQGRPTPGSLIERIEAVASRLETLVNDDWNRLGEMLLFDGYVPVLLNDGRIKVHGWSVYELRRSPHRSDDDCVTMTVDEWRDRQANPIAIG